MSMAVLAAVHHDFAHARLCCAVLIVPTTATDAGLQPQVASLSPIFAVCFILGRNECSAAGMPYTNLPYSRRAMDLPVPVPRDALRTASAEAAAATEKASDASDLARQSLAVLDRARAAAAAYAVIDTIVVASHAGSLTPCAAGGAHGPDDLSEAKLAQAAAEEMLVGAEAAHALLVSEAVEATNEATQAEARKIAAIADVMKATAVSMLPQLRDAEALAGRLRASIAGYMNCWALNDGQAFKPVPVEVSVVFKEPQGGPLMALASLNWQQAAARWQEYRTELAIDPDAAPPAALG